MSGRAASGCCCCCSSSSNCFSFLFLLQLGPLPLIYSSDTRRRRRRPARYVRPINLSSGHLCAQIGRVVSVWANLRASQPVGRFRSQRSAHLANYVIRVRDRCDVARLARCPAGRQLCLLASALRGQPAFAGDFCERASEKKAEKKAKSPRTWLANWGRRGHRASERRKFNLIDEVSFAPLAKCRARSLALFAGTLTSQFGRQVGANLQERRQWARRNNGWLECGRAPEQVVARAINHV